LNAVIGESAENAGNVEERDKMFSGFAR